MTENNDGRQRRARADDERPVRMLAADGDYEVEVSRALNKWCVTVIQVADRAELAQDYFPERWKALARAQDFVRLLNQRQSKEEADSFAG